MTKWIYKHPNWMAFIAWLILMGMNACAIYLTHGNASWALTIIGSIIFLSALVWNLIIKKRSLFFLLLVIIPVVFFWVAYVYTGIAGTFLGLFEILGAIIILSLSDKRKDRNEPTEKRNAIKDEEYYKKREDG